VSQADLWLRDRLLGSTGLVPFVLPQAMPMQIREVGPDDERHEFEFKFHHLPDAKFASFGNPEIQPLLSKWGFGSDMVMCTFRVEQAVGPDSLGMMLEAFFRDRTVLAVLNTICQLRVTSPSRVCVHWQDMLTKVVSMNFFQKLEDCGAVGVRGHIRGRVPEEVDGIPVVNLIREAILMEESELYDTFSQEDRQEFLYRIFSHVVFGGAQNQYEDHVEDYFKATKAIYKDLLSVRRKDTGDVEVTSRVALVQDLGEGGRLFPVDNPLNFCYVIYDPTMRHVRFWYFGYRSIW